MHYTVLLSPESDPPGYVAYVPLLGVVTQGETIEAALQAAGEAARLGIRGRLRHDEAVPAEPVDCVLAKIEVELPVPAAAS